MKEAYSPKEVLEMIPISRNALYDAIRRREIPSVRIGKRILIPRLALERWLNGSVETPTSNGENGRSVQALRFERGGHHAE